MYLLLITLLVLAVYIWYESLRMREYLIQYCQRICREAGLQFLDQSIALITLSFRKSAYGLPQLYRRYQFVVSVDGINRCTGYIEVQGKRIISVCLQNEHQQNIILEYGNQKH
jgi:hypothetical protein